MKPRHLKLSLGLAVVAPVLREAVIYGLGAATPGYSAARDFLSELGALEAPYRIPMNILGIGLIGIMMVSASLGLWAVARGSLGGRAAAVLVGISGVAFVFVASFPCDPGCSTTAMGPRMIIHLLAGFLAMGALVLAATAFGVSRIRQPVGSTLGWVSLTLGISGTAAYAVLALYAADLTHPGMVQRIVQGTGDLWLLLAGIASLQTVSTSSLERPSS